MDMQLRIFTMDFKQRLMDEKQQLDERTGKLGSFIDTEAFQKIDPRQQELLRCQYSVMQSYVDILERRIELLA
jgi:hypothetical protein